MNFNPSVSFTGYGIPIKGKFRIILNTDDPLFGGQGRIDTSQTYFSVPDQGHYGVTAPHHLKLYLPATDSNSAGAGTGKEHQQTFRSVHPAQQTEILPVRELLMLCVNTYPVEEGPGHLRLEIDTVDHPALLFAGIV